MKHFNIILVALLAFQTTNAESLKKGLGRIARQTKTNVEHAKNIPAKVERETKRIGKQINREYNRIEDQFEAEANRFRNRVKAEYDRIEDQTKTNFRHGWPVVARGMACLSTACLSEVRLHQVRKEEQAKARRKINKLRAELKAAAKARDVKMMEEKIAELEVLLESNEKVFDSFDFSLGLTKGLSIALNGEIEKRNILKEVGAKFESRVIGTSPFAGVVKIVVDTKNIGEKEINGILETLSKLAAETKDEVEMVVDTFTASLDTASLQKLIAAVDANMDVLLQEFTELATLKVELKNEIAFWEVELTKIMGSAK